MTNFEKIRAQLESERKRLTDELESRSSQQAVDIREGSLFGKPEEMASENIELTSRLTAAQHTREQLARVERALEKLAAGTYGLCDSCGKPISPERLKAIPQANLCMKCKARQEKDSQK